VKIVILSSANQRDFDELPERVKRRSRGSFVDSCNEIFRIVFDEESVSSPPGSQTYAKQGHLSDESPLSAGSFPPLRRTCLTPLTKVNLFRRRLG
jgi:hypothetical protein